MDVQNISGLVGKYGFPIIAAMGVGYMIFHVWRWATEDIEPVLTEANKVAIGLIDRIRMLDQDLLRLNMKLKTVLMMREIYNRKSSKPDQFSDTE